MFRGRRDDPRRRGDYAQVIQKVLRVELAPDGEGAVQLPPELASASKGGKVWLSQRDRGQVLIAFLTWVGKGYNMRGYLYATEPLTDEDTYRDYYGNLALKVGPTDVVIERKLDEHWYGIARSLD